VTGFHLNISRIGESIDRQCDDTHEGEWARPSHRKDLSDIVLIDKIDKQPRKCRSSVEIFLKSPLEDTPFMGYEESDRGSERIDVESSMRDKR
jgi:hypothetical protein